MTIRIGNPFPVYLDRRGFPLDGGKLYIGAEGADPELSPVTVYLDEALTVPVTQAISVIGGRACWDGNPALFYIAGDVYSFRTKDKDGAEVEYSPKAVFGIASFQPLDTDLTAIAALATASYGRGVLTQSSAAALRTYLGLVDYLAQTGGTVTGNIVRSSAGTHLYHNDSALSSGRVFVTANGAADPTSQPGDIWLELEA